MTPNTKTKQVWLIRHGETAWSKTGQHTGRTDLSLLPEAEPKLTALKPSVETHPFNLVLSSPLQRALRTAELVGLKGIGLDDNLLEWNYGTYEGKTRAEILTQVPAWSLWTDGAPDGETLQDVIARVRQVIQRARAIPGDVALVAHGHVLRVLAACWLNDSPLFAEHIALSTGSISILSYENDLPVIARWNWQPTLS